MTKYLDYIGLSDYDGKIKELVNSKIAQVETLPTPSASNNGTILEYIGATTGNLINGYFYKSDGSAWTAHNIQPHPTIAATASVDNNVGTPAVTVTKSGTDDSPSFAFDFVNMKGDTGADGTPFQVKAQYATYADMIAAHPTGNVGDAFQVGSPVDYKVNVSAIAPVEDGATASVAYEQGEYFMHNGYFCKAKTAIASGDTFTANTNYEVTTIAAALRSHVSTAAIDSLFE